MIGRVFARVGRFGQYDMVFSVTPLGPGILGIKT